MLKQVDHANGPVDVEACGSCSGEACGSCRC